MALLWPLSGPAELPCYNKGGDIKGSIPDTTSTPTAAEKGPTCASCHQLQLQVIDTFEGYKLGCVNNVSSYFSAATSAVCIVGPWGGRTEQKQEAPLPQ